MNFNYGSIDACPSLKMNFIFKTFFVEMSTGFGPRDSYPSPSTAAY